MREQLFRSHPALQIVARLNSAPTVYFIHFLRCYPPTFHSLEATSKAAYYNIIKITPESNNSLKKSE